MESSVEVYTISPTKIWLANCNWDTQADACSFVLLHGTGQEWLNDWGPYALVHKCYYSNFSANEQKASVHKPTYIVGYISWCCSWYIIIWCDWWCKTRLCMFISKTKLSSITKFVYNFSKYTANYSETLLKRFWKFQENLTS